MRYLISFALLFPMVVFAKDPPLPDALLNAKTAFVEKVVTAQESFDKYCRASRANADAKDKNLEKSCKSLKASAKADKKLFDKFCKELNKWGRFTLVQDRRSADVLILLGRSMRTTMIKTAAAVTDYSNGPSTQVSVRIDASSSVYRPETIEEVHFNVRDGRNNVLLYSDQQGGPGKLVLNLKKKMEQK